MSVGIFHHLIAGLVTGVMNGHLLQSRSGSNTEQIQTVTGGSSEHVQLHNECVGNGVERH